MTAPNRDHERGLQVLLDALTVHVAPGDLWTFDTIRDAMDAAQLQPAQTRAAVTQAIAGGWVEPVLLPLGSRDVHACIPSTHPPARGRRLGVYRRTQRPTASTGDAA